jgi:hypothetical protein
MVFVKETEAQAVVEHWRNLPDATARAGFKQVLDTLYLAEHDAGLHRRRRSGSVEVGVGLVILTPAALGPLTSARMGLGGTGLCVGLGLFSVGQGVSRLRGPRFDLRRNMLNVDGSAMWRRQPAFSLRELRMGMDTDGLYRRWAPDVRRPEVRDSLDAVLGAQAARLPASVLAGPFATGGVVDFVETHAGSGSGELAAKLAASPVYARHTIDDLCRVLTRAGRRTEGPEGA